MKVKSSKNLARHEKKKEKLAALLVVTKMNEKDRFKESKDVDISSENPTEPTCKKSRKCSDNAYDVKCSDSLPFSDVLENVAIAKDTTENSVKLLKEEYKQCVSRRKVIPKIRLKRSGECAELSVQANERVPLMLTDVQHLLLHSLLHDRSPYQPSRWYHLEKGVRISHTTCLVIEGVSFEHWQDNHSMFTFSDSNFKTKIEVITPAAYDGSLVEELAAVPLNNTEKEYLIKKYGSMDSAMEYRKDLMVMMKAVFPIEEKEEEIPAPSLADKIPRTQLILSAWQLVEENYPLPLKGKLQSVYADYVMTKDVYKPVTANSPMFGVDCEMCMTSVGSELTRISVVNEKHETVYETLVQPYNNIVNYLTMYSGITKAKMAGVTKRLEDVQKELREILPPDAILVGQSLNSDLNALKMMHPYVIDTSVIFNITGERTRKSKLKTLAFEFLKQNIQGSKSGHCSIEDSLTSLRLVQLKLGRSMEYGDAVLTSKKRCAEGYSKIFNEKTETQYASTIFNHMVQQKVSSTIIGCEDILGDYHDYLTKANECCDTLLLSKKGKPKKVKLNTVEKHSEVIETFCKISKDNRFTMGHVKLDMMQECANSQTKMIDKWIQEIWVHLPELTLFVVILGGNKTGNGVALIQIKK